MKHYLMCSPEHFDVRYRINPWMHPSMSVNADRALRQWERLRQTYEALGHRVDLLEPSPEFPDMVFTANGALVIDGTAWVARFRHRQRAGEAALHRAWLEEAGFNVIDSRHVHEGEGDFLLVGDTIVAGYGFRTEFAAHREAAALFDREVISVHLVDPRLYHLDTAFMVIDHEMVAYYPGAFDSPSRGRLRRRFPDAIRIHECEALAFALNATSDGHDVVLTSAAPVLDRALRRRGYRTHALEFDETLAAGGSIKCCTLELRGPSSADRPCSVIATDHLFDEREVQVA